MPISEAALADPRNRHIAVKGSASVAQAIAALEAQGGQAWWHLLVRREDGRWGATTFAELHRRLAGRAEAASLRLGEWDSLTDVASVAREALDQPAAEALARRSPGGLLVVTEGDVPAGILFQGTRGGGPPLPLPRLTELRGAPVDLKDYGSILLSPPRK